MSKGANRFDTKRLVVLALFSAIVIVLQFVCMTFLRFTAFSITLTLVPIVVGAALYGPKAGGWLGFVFALAVLLTGDAAAFLTVNPFGTVVTVLAKGILSGFCSGLVYRALEKKSVTLAVFVAAVVAPVVNTGVFLLGCLVFFFETVREWGANAGFENVGAYFIVGFVGINFVIELVVNVILGPVIVRLIRIARKEGIGDKKKA